MGGGRSLTPDTCRIPPHPPSPLTAFPAQTHALTLVSDPDGVLADEALLAALVARGFTLIRETDPVQLRGRVEAARPWTLDHPVIVITPGALNALPYDLWQQGHHVTLALHMFFPNLAYPVVRALSPSRRGRLAAAPPPTQRLGERATQHYVLQHAFALNLEALHQPAYVITWLDTYHAERDPLPESLLTMLLARLQSQLAYRDWPLASLLGDAEHFTRFVREQWAMYTQRVADVQGTQYVREAAGRYLHFGADTALQDALAHLVRTGTLAPVPVARPARMPNWARPALLAAESDRAHRRAAELLALVQASVAALSPAARWPAWQRLAWSWAELTALRYRADADLEAAQVQLYHQVQVDLDAAFAQWLPGHYAPLAIQSLPEPQHVYHVPQFLIYRYLQKQQPVALLILDGMALADWTLIRETWQARHAHWKVEERLLLAQVPTITSISRQALVSGHRPATFAASLHTTRKDAARWQTAGAHYGLEKSAIYYAHLRLDREPPPQLSGTRTRWACLVDTSVDDLVHGATLGQEDFYASLAVWVEGHARRLEGLIAALLRQGFAVAITSDHGHTEAQGMGVPHEGLAVESRSKRARLYTDARAAARAQQVFPETVLWRKHGLLPDDVSVLMPCRRLAFALDGVKVVTHGGPTLDEVVVVLAMISERGADG